MSKRNIRMATLDDAQAILDIYEPFILNSVITFETDKIPLDAFKERMASIMSQFPWLVYTIDGKIAGYAYGSPHYTRAAYAWDCELSVYISEDFHRMGIGAALCEALFHIVTAQGYYNMYSLICVPNEGSVALHKKCGFFEVGTYCNTAYKFDQWLDVLIMEKKLKEPIGKPKPVIPVGQLDSRIIETACKLNRSEMVN